MKFNRNILLLVTLALLALNQAAQLRLTPNSDNPGLGPIGKPNKVIPPPVVVQPKPVPEKPITGAGYGNFSRSCSGFKYNETSFILSANCKNNNGSPVSATVNINKCFVSSDDNILESASWYNSNMDKYCINCKVNLNSVKLTCDCVVGGGARNKTTMNLNVNISNSNGSLSC